MRLLSSAAVICAALFSGTILHAQDPDRILVGEMRDRATAQILSLIHIYVYKRQADNGSTVTLSWQPSGNPSRKWAVQARYGSQWATRLSLIHI